MRASQLDRELDEVVGQLQGDLFALGAQIADPADKLASRVTKAILADSDASMKRRRVGASQA